MTFKEIVYAKMKIQSLPTQLFVTGRPYNFCKLTLVKCPGLKKKVTE